MNSVTLVVATRFTDNSQFESLSFLGTSLRRIPPELRPETRVKLSNIAPNEKGLSEIYNDALDDPDLKTDCVVFIHDDVFIHDWFIKVRLAHALQQFDVVGVAGSANPRFEYPNWGLKFDEDLNPTGWQDDVTLSGAVNHGDYGCPNFAPFGDTPAECKMLDGLFLAINARKVRDARVRFDPQFRFHCYDLDFCRSAKSKKLRIGTWPIAVTHGSGGSFNSEDFKKAARKYLKKWENS